MIIAGAVETQMFWLNHSRADTFNSALCLWGLHHGDNIVQLPTAVMAADLWSLQRAIEDDLQLVEQALFPVSTTNFVLSC